MSLSVIPTLYVACKFSIPIHFTIPAADGTEVDYDDVGTPPQVFWSIGDDHDAIAADGDLNCDMTYSGAGGIWQAEIEAPLLTYALLFGEFGNPSNHASPGTKPVLIMIVPNSSRDFAGGAWYSKREALAA